MAMCAYCGKKTVFGRQESKKRKNKTNRMFKPNLQHKTIIENGHKQTLTLCTRCMRTANKIRE